MTGSLRKLTTTVLAVAVFAATAYAKDFSDFFQYFIDLDSWHGGIPQGSVVELDDKGFMSSWRTYRKDGSIFTLYVMQSLSDKGLWENPLEVALSDNNTYSKNIELNGLSGAYSANTTGMDGSASFPLVTEMGSNKAICITIFEFYNIKESALVEIVSMFSLSSIRSECQN